MSSTKLTQINLSAIMFQFILKPAASGLYGFASFFLIIIISKYFVTFIGTTNSFNVDITDLQLSFLGFFFVFLINFLKNLQNYKSAE
jgi:hypothetical protein